MPGLALGWKQAGPCCLGNSGDPIAHPRRGDISPFPVNEAVVCSLLSQSLLVWQAVVAERKGQDSP